MGYVAQSETLLTPEYGYRGSQRVKCNNRPLEKDIKLFMWKMY